MTTAVLDRTWHQDPPVGLAAKPDRKRRRTEWVAVAAFVVIAGLIGTGILVLGHSDNRPSTTSGTSGTLIEDSLRKRL